MKKYVITLLLLALITPSIVFASWWNPFSWKIFNRGTEVKIEKLEPVITPPSKPVNIPAEQTRVLEKASPTSPAPVIENAKITPITTQKEENANLKIAKCQSIRDIRILNIENEVNKQLVVVFNNLGLFKKIEDYQSDIDNLEAQRQSLLKQQLLSPVGKYAPGGDVSQLGVVGALNAVKTAGSEYEPAIQSLEKQILEKKNYLAYLNNAIDKIKKDPEIINKLKNAYFDEYNKCLSSD